MRGIVLYVYIELYSNLLQKARARRGKNCIFPLFPLYYAHQPGETTMPRMLKYQEIEGWLRQELSRRALRPRRPVPFRKRRSAPVRRHGGHRPQGIRAAGTGRIYRPQAGQRHLRAAPPGPSRADPPLPPLSLRHHDRRSPARQPAENRPDADRTAPAPSKPPDTSRC